MIVELVTQLFNEYRLLLVLFGVLGSFFVTSASLPFIIYFCKTKGLTAKIDERSSHSRDIPNIGGIGIIAGVYITSLFLSYFIINFENAKLLISLFIPLLILLFIGFKDDMLGLSPKAKLLTEIGTATIFIVLSDCRLDSFYGLFGIYEINYYLSITLSIFVFVITINSYNLIDGIDGLAGGFGIIACGFLFFMSQKANNMIAVILCASIIGSLTGFLKFNLSSDKKKIFMGDTGSLIVGFLISSIVLIALSSKNNYISSFNNIPVILLAILSFPFIDTLRVMLIRKKRKKNLFKPDKNHIHHMLINQGHSHIKSTILILIVYTTCVMFCLATTNLEITIHFFACLIYSIISLNSLLYFIKK